MLRTASAVLAGAVAGAAGVHLYSQPQVPSHPKVHPSLSLGSPGTGVDLLVDRENFTLCYDRRLRHARWTAERLTSESLQGKASRRSARFKEDEAIEPSFRARIEDYRQSGFDRGHLVPAADMKVNDAAMQQTFLLSNITPQVGKGFNRDYWERLERWCRSLPSLEEYVDVLVYTGPLYLASRAADSNWSLLPSICIVALLTQIVLDRYVNYQMIGADNTAHVSVPTHFFKVVACQREDGEYDVGAFVLPNAHIDSTRQLESFSVEISELEVQSGLRFLRDFKGKFRPMSSQLCKLPGGFMMSKH